MGLRIFALVYARKGQQPLRKLSNEAPPRGFVEALAEQEYKYAVVADSMAQAISTADAEVARRSNQYELVHAAVIPTEAGTLVLVSP